MDTSDCLIGEGRVMGECLRSGLFYFIIWNATGLSVFDTIF